MNTYTIYLEATPVANVSGTEYAYGVYATAKKLAKQLGITCTLVRDDTAGEVTSYDPKKDIEYEIDEVR